MIADYLVYSMQEFLEVFKASPDSMQVHVLPWRNQDNDIEQLCFVREGPRRLRLFLEESTDLIEQLLKAELREGNAIDKHKAVMKSDVTSRALFLQAGGRLTVHTLAHVKEAAAKLEAERLRREVEGGAGGGAGGQHSLRSSFEL